MIEALFSALILGIALLALAGFQVVALQDSSLIKARSVAANLAQEKLDDLRSFTYLTDGTTADDANAATTSNYCGQGTFCFSEIATNAGGQETSSGSLVIPTGSVSGYLDSYSRTWTVTCSAEIAATAFSFSSTCNSTTVARLVTVTISWTDSKGASQSLSLQGVIYAMDPSRITRGTLNPSATQRPQQPYTTVGVPDAVPINLGDGKYKESSKPLPDVSSKGYSLRTEFDSVTYTTAGGTTKKDSQLQFATVNCVCQFAGNGQGYPASYFYWDGATLDIKTPAATITKMTGTAPSINGDSQDSLCDACCRDHHDSEAPGSSSPATALYDPDRPSADYTGNNHKHYYYVNSSQPAQGLTEVSETAGNRYLEACRFARVDGVYRLLQDWRALDLVVMPYDNASAGISYLSDATTLAKYQAYLINYLKYQTQADCTSASGTGCTNIGQSTAPDKASTSVLPSRNLSGLTQPAQLLARALYTDRVYGEDTPRTLNAAYYTYLSNKISSEATWLDILPFNEVNVTLLNSWASSNTSVVTVSNEQIRDIGSTASDYYGVYSRGSAQMINSSGSSTLYTYLLPSNSGLTGGVTRCTYPAVQGVNCNTTISGDVVDYNSSLVQSGTIPYASEIGIDRHDHRQGDYTLGSDRNRLRDSITISASDGSIASGQIRAGNAAAQTAFVTGAVTLTGNPSATCSVSAPVLGVASYSCSLSGSYSGTVQASTTLANGFFDVGGDTTYDTENLSKGYSASVANLPENACHMDTGGVDNSCKVFWLFGNTISITGTCSGSACDSATITSNDGSGAVPCTNSSGTVTCTVTLDSTSKTWSGAITISGTRVSATSSCDSSSPSNASTTSFTAGPKDMQSAFNLCATTSAVSVPPATPVLGWGSGTPQSILWSSVSGATGYKVYTCTQADTTSPYSLQTCTPSTSGTPASIQATTSYVPTTPSVNSTVCVSVQSYNSSGNSSATSPYCIFVKNSNNNSSSYNYSP